MGHLTSTHDYISLQLRTIGLLFLLAISGITASGAEPDQILQEIQCATGTASVVQLVITNSDQYIARYHNGTIALEQKALKALRQLGKDSTLGLAYVLAHELAHVHLDHGWARKTGSAFADTEFGKRLMKQGMSMESRIVDETHADLFAALYGYQAGYPVLNVAERALRVLYQEYQLPEDIPGYPSLSQRINIIRVNQEKFASLAVIFQAGNLNLVTGNYALASACYREILAGQYHGREVLNNLGLALALEALCPFFSDTDFFLLPMQLEQHTMLGQRVRAPLKEDAVLLLKEAVSFFREAYLRDTKYSKARINYVTGLLYLHRLTGDEQYADDAEPELKRLMRLNEKEHQAEVLILRANRSLNEGNRLECLDLLRQAERKGSRLARLNLDRVSGSSTTAPALDLRPETIAGVRLSGYLGETLAATQHRIANGNVQSVPFANSVVYSTRLNKNGDRIESIIQLADKSFSGETSRHIRIGSSLSMLIGNYGEPDHVMNAGTRAFFSYGKANLVFAVDQGRVSQIITGHRR